jgi:hypothetical protein
MIQQGQVLTLKTNRRTTPNPLDLDGYVAQLGGR